MLSGEEYRISMVTDCVCGEEYRIMQSVVFLDLWIKFSQNQILASQFVDFSHTKWF